MANKSEKSRAWQLDKMAQKIQPLTPFGSRTTTATEIGKSWFDHEPLWKRLSIAIKCNAEMMHYPKDSSDYQYVSDQYEKAVDEFWELNRDIFNESDVKRLDYVKDFLQ